MLRKILVSKLGLATLVFFVLANVLPQPFGILFTLCWLITGAPLAFKLFRAFTPAAVATRTDTFAELRATYPFITDNSEVFQKPFSIDFSARDGSFQHFKFRRLSPREITDFEHALTILQIAAVFEAHRRGYRITDDLNKIVMPHHSPDGFVLETTENDDGSVDALVAYDVAGTCSRQDYDLAFYQLGILARWTNWEGTAQGPDKKNFDGFPPLCRPALRQVRVTQANTSPNPFRPRSTEKGAAQWAWVDEMKQRGAPVSLIAGSTVDFSRAFAAPGAVLGTFHADEWTANNPEPRGAVFANGEGHRVVVGPPGSGKFTAAFAPLLLTADTASAFVFDVANGEAARVTAPWRAKLGPVLVIDPFGVSGLESGALNPLDFLRRDDPDVLQAAKRLADALFIVPPGDSKDEYFNDQARDVLTAFLLHVATDELETDRTLRRVREMIRRPLTPELLAAMQDNPIAGGVVADTAANLIAAMRSDAEKNTFYVTQTLRANTAFLDLPAVQRATETTSLDPRQLRREVSTLYVCLPEAQLAAVGRWLRLVYATVMEQVREQSKVPLHVLVDEFPSLGKFSRVKDDMALVRKFGIHIHIATQSLTQLEGIYGADWQSFMAAAKYQQLMGANDQMTADYFSRSLGKTTRQTTSTGQSRSTGGGSQSESSGWEAADLQSPDELRRMSSGTTIVVVEGMHPLILGKLRYHEVEGMMSRVSPAPALTSFGDASKSAGTLILRT